MDIEPTRDERDTTGADAWTWADAISAAVHDPARLDSVRSTGLLDTAPEAPFGRLVELAADVLQVPWAFVTLVDDRRSFWKGSVGTDPGGGREQDRVARENPVGESFCQYVIAIDGPLIVADVRSDDRTKHNLSIEAMGVVAWAGFPVRSADGHVLGSFCAVDRRPHAWSPSEIALLETLAGAASSEVQLRTALRTATETAHQLSEELAARRLITDRTIALAELAQRLSAAATVDAIIDTITTTGRAVFDAALVNLALVDVDRHELHLFAASEVSAVAEPFRVLPIDATTPLGAAVAEGRPVYLRDRAELELRFPELVQVSVEAGVHSTASMPLFHSDGTLVGALGVAWSAPNEFVPIVVSLLTTVGETCSLALERAQLGDARREFVELLQHALTGPIIARPGLEIVAEYLPSRAELGLGGDWYDVLELGPTTTAIIVGDVVGHGIAAAATMTRIRAIVNAMVRTRVDRLADVFDDTEAHLGVRERTFLATLAVHVIDTAAGEIRTVSAGHPPSLLIAPDGGLVLLDGGRRPVLGWGARCRVEPQVTPFPPGSALVAYTDGLVELARRDIDAGIAELHRVLAQRIDRPLRDIASAIVTELTPGAPDDIAFAIVRRLES